MELSSFTTDGETTRAAIIATGLVEMLAKVAGTTTDAAAIRAEAEKCIDSPEKHPPAAYKGEQEYSWMSRARGCNLHPDAPHGFDRDASHNAGRYVCECEGWEPPPTEAAKEAK